MDPELPLPADPSAVPTPPAVPLPTGTGLAGTGATVPDAGGDPLARLADGVLAAARDALASVGRVWAGAPGELDEPAVGQVAGALAWYLTATAVVAVLVAAGRMAWHRDGAPLRDLLVALATLVLVTAAGTAATALAVVAADGLARAVLGGVAPDASSAVTGLVDLDTLSTVPPVTALLVGSGVLLAALGLVAVLVVRVVGLVVLTGVLPVSAAAVNTGPGRGTAVRVAAWLAALVVWQPVAALVLAAGVLVLPELPGGDDPVVRAAGGGVVLALAALALPACAAALRPAVAVVATRGSATPVGATAPTGAVPLARSRTGHGTRGPGGSVRVLHGTGRAPRPVEVVETAGGLR